MYKLFKYLTITIFGIGLIVFIIYTYNLDQRGNQKEIKEQFRGVISEIKIFDGNRGMPSIKVNNDWIHLGLLEAKIRNYIQVGDSITKEAGSLTINIYRKNANGGWYVKILK